MPDATQISAILNHLKTHDGITSMEAFQKYGATRLSAVIFTLRRSGYNIITEMQEGQNRYGTPVRYAKYVLRDSQN